MSNIIQDIADAKQKRKKVHEDQRAITNTARKEQRALTADEETAYEKAESDFKIYDDEVRRLETLKEREERLALDQHEQREGGNHLPGDDEDEIREAETRAQTKARQKEELRYDKAFRKYLRFGMEALEKEERAILRQRFDAGNAGKGEVRAAQTVTTSGGGYAIPQGFAGRVEEIMKYFGPMVDGGVTGELRTTSGNNIPYPTLDGTGTKGRLLTINTAVTETALTFGKVDLDAYKFSSDLITVPYELLEDEEVNLESLLDNQLGERLGRIMNEYFTTGTGSSQPNGVVTASALGKTTASATAFTRPEIIDLIHSIDKAYRMNPKSGLMMHDLIFAAIRKLALGSGDATPLYQISAIAGQSDKIEGMPVFINNDMSSAVTTGLKIMLCGDFSKFIVRKVNGTRMFRLTERYADNDQVGFFGFMRADSDLIAANSIKHMITA